MNKNFIYSENKIKFFDKIVQKKRLEMVKIINDYFKEVKIDSILDIGTTKDKDNESSNILIKSIEKKSVFKSISDQLITSSFFNKKLRKSITENFSKEEIYEFSSDLVISNATIEHVGNAVNQEKMLKNIINLTKKFFVIITPNRYHPLELHTLIPLAHWLPKIYHRKLLKFFGLNFYSDEKNLNLLSENDIKKMIEKEKITYSFKYVRFLFFKSNLILFGKK
tara:strand:- start:759 stop:1427 length:669 start_codon:yes stop_codon:yes gene_type:complete